MVMAPTPCGCPKSRFTLRKEAKALMLGRDFSGARQTSLGGNLSHLGLKLAYLCHISPTLLVIKLAPWISKFAADKFFSFSARAGWWVGSKRRRREGRSRLML